MHDPRRYAYYNVGFSAIELGFVLILCLAVCGFTLIAFLGVMAFLWPVWVALAQHLLS
jgi:hypothetical protein